MNNLQYKTDSFLKTSFDNFIRQVINFKRSVSNTQWQRDRKIRNEGDFVDHVQKQLRASVENFGISGNYNDVTPSVIEEVKYIMISICDEVFLHLDWDGKNIWEKNLMEKTLFDSHIAGVKIFKNLESLFTSHTAYKYDLAYLYLTCLGLGFLGKYRNSKDYDEVDLYKRKLYNLIYDHDPTLGEAEVKISNDAYQHTIEHSDKNRLIDFSAWYSAFALVIFTLFIVAEIVWRQNTNKIIDRAKAVVDYQERSQEKEIKQRDK